jgi:hypothetical protein
VIVEKMKWLKENQYLRDKIASEGINATAVLGGTTYVAMSG